jgi:hypothetical protein
MQLSNLVGNFTLHLAMGVPSTAGRAGASACALRLGWLSPVAGLSDPPLFFGPFALPGHPIMARHPFWQPRGGLWPSILAAEPAIL